MLTDAHTCSPLVRMADLTESIKARIAPETLKRLEQIAEARELAVSDIAREALRDYLAKQLSGEQKERVA